MKKVWNFGLMLVKEFFLLILGVFVAGFGLKSFLIPAGFIDGGVTGISLLISFITPISISLLIFILNIPFMFLARRQVGKIFAFKTFVIREYVSNLTICTVFFVRACLTI